MTRITPIVWVVVIVMVMARGAWAQTTAPVRAPVAARIAAPVVVASAKPTSGMDQKNCVTSECHADVKNYKVLHGPINVNACDACHKLVDPAQHTFQLLRDKTQTCTFCHQVDTRGDAVVHKPLTQGQCLSCHNPHGGKTGRFLRGNSEMELCVQCHKDRIGGQSHVHGPVAAGACGSCHLGHSSKNKNLLIATGKDLCFSCHAEMKTQMAQVKFTHKAVEQDCTSCHDPHASNFVMQTKMAPAELCTSCHEHDKVKQVAMGSPTKHSPVLKEQACLNCHTAHGGNLAKLMKSEPINVCMKCHKDKIDAGGGKIVKAVAEVLDPNQVKHGPIQQGDCGGCHNVHGSQVPKLLVKSYPQAFYQPFSPDKYELCFTCHNKQLVETEKTTGLTGFRHGDRNLHFAHVNKLDRGRSCRACHETHASPQPLHVREAVPYGNWNMPINFVKTENGGSCAPGCHKPYLYDRGAGGAPVAPPPPATQPAPARTASADGKVGTP